MGNQRQNFPFRFPTIQHMRAVWFRLKVFSQWSDCTSEHTLCEGLYNSNTDHCWLSIQYHQEKGTTYKLSSTAGDLQWYHSEAAFILQITIWFLITKADFHLTLGLFTVRNRTVQIKDFDPDK